MRPTAVELESIWMYAYSKAAFHETTRYVDAIETVEPDSTLCHALVPASIVAYARPFRVDEITNTGTIVRSIPLIGADWSNVQGIEYDPTIDKLFATQIGDFLLMRIDAATGVLENFVNLSYGNDLFLTQSNTLLVGSYTQPPGIFDENLTSIGSLGTDARIFVTQYTAAGPTPAPTPCPRFAPTPRPRPAPRPRPTPRQ